MPQKRRLLASAGDSDPSGSRSKQRSEDYKIAKRNHLDDANSRNSKDDSESSQFRHIQIEEKYDIVQREIYPPEISNERCAMYINNEIPRPIEVLEQAIEETKEARAMIKAGDTVLHWFKRDLRTYDNRALSLAAKKAKEDKVPLACLFIVSPQDYQAHYTCPAKVDFELRTLKILKRDLAGLNIPLLIVTKDKRMEIPEYIVGLCEDWGIKNVFCNIEYEVDELRREAKLIRMCLKKGINFTPVHDDVIVSPGDLKTGTGKQYAVYSPWFRAWVAHLHSYPQLLNESKKPDSNPVITREKFKSVFESPVPEAPENKRLTNEEKRKFAQLWPAGEHEAKRRLERFLKEKVEKYRDTRNFPAVNGTSMISVHHSAGTLAPRTSIRIARDLNPTKKLDGGNAGIVGWISEIAWREFYKHVLVHWPYVCMSKPFKLEYTNVEWEYNNEHFVAWCQGRTGFPIVDAAMRQMNQIAYMHNRCRMIAASFLAKDLLLDWRMGEKYFMEHLIDGDFASNNGGWGFSASTGIDPQPYFRIFNPVLQSEKFDPDGEYIRKWVPELKSIKGKAIHDPYGYGEGNIAEKNGYPKPIVDHKLARNRALVRYKQCIDGHTA